MGDSAMAATVDRKVVTFVAGGEHHEPGTIHGWDEALAAMERGLPVRTTQMRLLDSYPSRHVYDEILIEDGDETLSLTVTERGFLHEASGKEWHKFARPFVLWHRGDLSCGGRRVAPAPRPMAAGPAPEETDSLRVVTFVTDGGDADTICGWKSADALLSMGASFHTTQMGFLDDPRLAEIYDVVVIDEGDRRLEFMSDDGTWATDATDRRISQTRNNLFCLWRNGEFSRDRDAGDEDAARDGAEPEETRVTLYAEFADAGNDRPFERTSPYSELVRCDACRHCGTTECPLRVGLILMGRIDEAQALGRRGSGYCPYGERRGAGDGD